MLMSLDARLVQEWAQYGFYFFYAVALVEIYFLRRFNPLQFDWKETALTAVTLLVTRYVTYVLPFNLLEPLKALVWFNPLGRITVDTPLKLFLLFLVIELVFYWTHRMGHRMRFWWLTHSVHHSPKSYNFSTSLLNGITGKLVGNGFFFYLMIWVGFEGLAAMAVLLWIDLYQTLIHTSWMPKWGVLEKVLMTPSLHRVHHGSNEVYLDCNYGGSICLYDHVFGTYVAERDDIQIEYGLVNGGKSHNLFKVHFSPFVDFFKDLSHVRSFRHLLACFFSPPSVTENRRRPAHCVDEKPTQQAFTR